MLIALLETNLTLTNLTTMEEPVQDGQDGANPPLIGPLLPPQPGPAQLQIETLNMTVVLFEGDFELVDIQL